MKTTKGPEYNDDYVKGDKNDILGRLHGTAEPNSRVHHQMLCGIQVRCTEDIESAITKLSNCIAICSENIIASQELAAKATESLAKKVFWLNIIGTVATTLSVLVAIAALFS